MDSRKGVLAVISGFSGVGKGTVVKELLTRYPYALSVSATTRAPREGEVAGVSYHYITKEAFEERIEAGDFLEWAQYVEQYYGTPKSFVMQQLEQGKDVILEIEAEGAFKVRAQYPEALLIYMVPPNMQELKRRLIGRGTETKEKVEQRLKKAREEELERARHYDFLVVNDELESCIQELHRVIQTRTGVAPASGDLLSKLEQEAKELGF
ncbi:MAG: guanylate kinase [Lachnospiraceae bacterium]|jgi:guanylate kinase|nr:guanylate kinase [Lachnospiraceae bacterium]